MRPADGLERPAVAARPYEDVLSDVDIGDLSEVDFELDSSDNEQAQATELSFAEQRRRLVAADQEPKRPNQDSVHSQAYDTVRNGSNVPHKRKRESKHAPTEMSSKKPVSRAREAVEVTKVERRDPRFDQQISDIKAPEKAALRHKYGFLEDYRKDEMAILRTQIKKETDPMAKAKLEKTLSSMQSKLQAVKEQERRQRVVSQHNSKQRDAAKSGKQPYFLKDAEKQELYLKDKFENMKDSKALGTYLQKKRKRRSQKDRRQLG